MRTSTSSTRHTQSLRLASPGPVRAPMASRHSLRSSAARMRLQPTLVASRGRLTGAIDASCRFSTRSRADSAFFGLHGLANRVSAQMRAWPAVCTSSRTQAESDWPPRRPSRTAAERAGASLAHASAERKNGATSSVAPPAYAEWRAPLRSGFTTMHAHRKGPQMSIHMQSHVCRMNHPRKEEAMNRPGVEQ